MTERKAMIKAGQSLPVIRQCRLLAVPRASFYDRAHGLSAQISN